DEAIFGVDPEPDPPDSAIPPASAVPVGSGSIADYAKFFDLDGHDQIDFYLPEWVLPDKPLQFPIKYFASNCVHPGVHLMLSYDDDMRDGWPNGDVPVTRPSPAGNIYGTSAGADEIVGVTLQMATIPTSRPSTPTWRPTRTAARGMTTTWTRWTSSSTRGSASTGCSAPITRPTSAATRATST
ncbi:MAG: hypothetical protein ACYS5V_14800, partial [Planctomycetota bacterium]